MCVTPLGREVAGEGTMKEELVQTIYHRTDFGAPINDYPRLLKLFNKVPVLTFAWYQD